MQQSRPGEQRRLFTITNVTRVNSAIRSYCSCRRRGTVHRLHRAAAICRSHSFAARSTVPGRLTEEKTDSISIHLFSLPFRWLPRFPLAPATSANATVFAVPPHSNSWLYFNHQKCNLFFPVFSGVKYPITCLERRSNFAVFHNCEILRSELPNAPLRRRNIKIFRSLWEPFVLSK